MVKFANIKNVKDQLMDANHKSSKLSKTWVSDKPVNKISFSGR